MADSMCGPSNAMQNFQKHTTVDRTLQQDRLISRTGLSQGFRSAGPNAGVLDHEFESFQAGQLPLEQGFQPNTFQHAPNMQLQQQGVPNWASDFQRMNISSPAPQMQQQSFGMHAQQRQDTGGWHQDFARQHLAERSMQVATHTSSPYQSHMLGMGSQYNGFGAAPQQGMSIAQQKQPEDVFDEAAFERAFDEAARAEAESMQDSYQQESNQDNVEMGQDILLDQSAEVLIASDDLEKTSNELLSQQRIGADTIHDPLFEDQDQPHSEDPEELARTAAKLLDSVQHDQSAKFQNSQFMSLMRQFRDREKTVEGDAVVSRNGLDQDQDMDMDMRDQASLKYLCAALEHLALHPQFQITPNNVRKLLFWLVRMGVFFTEKSKDGNLRDILFTNAVRAQVIDVLQAILLQAWMAKLPSIESLASSLLSQSINPYCSSRREAQTDLAAAGSKATLTLTPSNIDNSFSNASDTDTKVRAFIEACISQASERMQAAMLDILPYTIPPEQKEGGRDTDVHLQRAKDVLGDYWEVGSSCIGQSAALYGYSVDNVMGRVEVWKKDIEGGGEYIRVGTEGEGRGD